MANQFFTGKILTTITIVVFVVLLILLVVFAVNALLLIFGAILFAVFLRGLTDLLAEKTGLGKGLSLAIVGLSLIFAFGGAIYLLAPDIADQVKELREQLPRSIDNLRGKLEGYNWGQTILQQIPAPEEIVNGGGESGETIKQVGKIFSSTISVFLKFVVFVLLSVYLAAEPQLYLNGFLRLFPGKRRERAREVLNAIGETLRWWLVGKFCSMIIIGILTTIGLQVLGVPLALTLGLFAAVTSFIPNFGPIIAVIPAALIALANNPITALYVFPLYYFIQVIESYLITPNIERHTVRLPPGVTISTQLILSVLIGGQGLILATPMVAVAMVLVKMLYVEDVLGDKAETLDDNSD
ncbi:MAG: AI-2E family transporter [Acidobacteriota bacterium]|nr:AI-2E family transporter [Acidobacteriota bacterium]